MKNILIAVLLVAAIALGAIAYQQANQTALNRAELKEVHEELAASKNQLQAVQEATDKAASVERSSKALQETLVKTSQFAKEKEQQATALQQQLADAKTNNSSNPMAGMAKMFKDPGMKEMIKNSQKAVMGPMIEKQYAALMQQLNLSAEDGGKLKTMLTDKMLAGADVGMSLMDDTLTGDDRKELTKKIKEQSDASDAEIKAFLGDNYPAFQSYEKTVPDRMVVSQFGDQLSGSLAMDDSQQQQLITALNTERSAFKWTTDFNNQNPGNGDYANLFTGDKLDQFTKEKEQFDGQFLDKAKGILSAEQLKEFEAFQKTQRDMQLMGLKMAASMFGGKK